MSATLRNALAAAVLVAVTALPSRGDGITGRVSGEKEQEFIVRTQAVRALEGEAEGIVLAGVDENGNVPDGVRVAAAERLNGARDLIAAIAADLAANGPYADEASVASANQLLDQAFNLNAAALKELQKPKLADSFTSRLVGADMALRLAQSQLSRLSASKKDGPALAANPDAPTACVDPDIKPLRKTATVTRADADAARGEALRARARGRKVVYPKYNGPKYLQAAKAPKILPNYYFAFEGTSAEPGYIYKSLERELFGPFEVKFQVGAFDPAAALNPVDTGSACVELDLGGSDPLQFLAVCGRRVDGGVQVFAQTHLGAVGSIFFDGVRTAQVRIVYDGVNFVCSAGSGAGAPDFILQTFAVGTLVQGETPLIPGIGASGLTKGAEIGLDEIYFTPK